MNPPSKPYSQAPLKAAQSISKDDRLGDGVNDIMDAITAEDGAVALLKHKSRDAAAEFTCKELSMVSPTKSFGDASEAESSSQNCGNDKMVTAIDASQKSALATTENMTLKSMFRQPSWNKNVELPQTTTISLESVTWQRYSRRSSYVGDMVVAQCGSKSNLSTAVENALGYETAQPDGDQQKRIQSALANDDYPPQKRRRFQRRNSYYVPETSRTNGQTSGFSWQAMDFLCGRSETEKVTATVD